MFWPWLVRTVAISAGESTRKIPREEREMRPTRGVVSAAIAMQAAPGVHHWNGRNSPNAMAPPAATRPRGSSKRQTVREYLASRAPPRRSLTPYPGGAHHSVTKNCRTQFSARPIHDCGGTDRADQLGPLRQVQPQFVQARALRPRQHKRAIWGDSPYCGGESGGSHDTADDFGAQKCHCQRGVSQQQRIRNTNIWPKIEMCCLLA